MSLAHLCNRRFQRLLRIGSTSYRLRKIARIHCWMRPYHLSSPQSIRSLNYKVAIWLKIEIKSTHLSRNSRTQYRSKMGLYTFLSMLCPLGTHFQQQSHQSPHTSYSRSMSTLTGSKASCTHTGRMDNLVEPCHRRQGSSTIVLEPA